MGATSNFDVPPGRVFIVHSSHTFGDLAVAIEAAFGRWDQSHLHEFRFAGIRVGMSDPDDPDVADEDQLSLAVLGGPGAHFEYEFDLGDGWTHRCLVEEFDHDIADLVGRPAQPTAVFGWGTLPDQYGRETPENEE